MLRASPGATPGRIGGATVASQPPSMRLVVAGITLRGARRRSLPDRQKRSSEGGGLAARGKGKKKTMPSEVGWLGFGGAREW